MKYKINPDITVKQFEDNLIFENRLGGKIISDEFLSSVWKYADGKSLDEITTFFQTSSISTIEIRAALACLSEANLLLRDNPKKQETYISPLASFDNRVSIIIVTFNGTQWIESCINSIYDQSHKNIEIIIVDNASTDNTVEFIKNLKKEVKIIPLEKKVSFAEANNIGINQTNGEFILLLNQDIKITNTALTELLNAYFQSAKPVAAVASKLKFLWAPEFINGLGNLVQQFSWGMDIGLGNLDLGQFDHWNTVPSACFAAVLIPKHIFNEVGYLDSNFPMYYEDSEWCYRAKKFGKKIIVAPKAEFLHAFGGKIPSGIQKDLPAWKLKHAIYGRLRWANKLLTGKHKKTFVKNYKREDISNFLGYLKKGQLNYCISILSAWFNLFINSFEISAERKKLTEQQVINNQTLIVNHFQIPPTFEKNGLPILNFENIKNYYLPMIKSGKTKTMDEFRDFHFPKSLLIVSNDIIAANMAGPGIRYLEMAKALSKEIKVTIAVPKATDFSTPEINIAIYDEKDSETLRVLVENHTHILISGYMPVKFPFLKITTAKIIVDLYDPFMFENLHYYLDQPMEVQEEHNLNAVKTINELIKIGDYFICGNDRQRDLWMGLLVANNRVSPQTFKQDSSLRSIIDVVGVGFPDSPPNKTPFLKNQIPHLPENAKIVLWGGGIWNWLDPLTLIKSWPEVLKTHPDAHLVMLGTRHPNPDVPLHEMANKTITLAKEIGECDKSIHFIEWVSYKEREALLNEADLGITLHPIHVETRYSIRTRVLDYMWAKLPIVITTGDITSEWVNDFNLGIVVPELDHKATSEAIIKILNQSKKHWEQNYQNLHQKFCWTEVVKPLSNYCLHGDYAQDRKERYNPEETIFPQPRKGKIKKAFEILREKGLVSMIKKIITHLRFLIFHK